MSNKYKFNNNNKNLSDEHIRKHQDFDGLMSEFRKQRVEQKKNVPFHRKRVVIYSLMAAASLMFIVGTVGYFSTFQNNADIAMVKDVSESAGDMSPELLEKALADNGISRKEYERAVGNQGPQGESGPSKPQGNTGSYNTDQSNNWALKSNVPPPPPVQANDGFYNNEPITYSLQEPNTIMDYNAERSYDQSPKINTESAQRILKGEKFKNDSWLIASSQEQKSKEYEDEFDEDLELNFADELVLEEVSEDAVSEELEELVKTEEIFSVVEEMPEFPGGDKKMLEYIYSNLYYPPLAKENGIEGLCVVSFVVEADGSISDIELKRDIGQGCGSAAKYTVQSMPKWKPGKQRGKPVAVTYNLPIRFKIDDGFKVKPKKQNKHQPVIENDFLAVNDKPLSTFSIDVDNASYSLVRQSINNNTLPSPNSVRIEEMINYFSYTYPKPNDNKPLSIHTELTNCPWNDDHQLALVALQGKSVDKDLIPKNNLVFLLDVSGSMNGSNKLPLVKKSISMLCDNMRPDDRVAIVVYAGAAGVVLPSTPLREKGKIMAAFNLLEAGGSTAGGEGINLAYRIAHENFIEGGNNRIILCTDGDFNVGPSSDDDLVRLIEIKRRTGVFLTVMGYGMGNYKDNKMEELSNAGNGNYAYIDNILEAKKVLVKEMWGTLLTIAKDVKLQIEFNPNQVRGYRLIGYVNRKLQDRDFNDDLKDAGELGAEHQVTALYEIIPVDSRSEFLTSAEIDPLKYQSPTKSNDQFGTQVMNVKLRYKNPNESKSIRMEYALDNSSFKKEFPSDDIGFASAVAAYGMLLQDSKYKGKADYDMVLRLAQSHKGNDKEGYRSEFLRMIERTQLLDNR